MREPEHSDDGLHDSVWLLLPWYANGSLAATEPARQREVEGHLALCARCRAEVERCRGLAAALLAEPDHAPSPHPVQLARLFARISEIESGQGESGQAPGAAGAASWAAAAAAEGAGEVTRAARQAAADGAARGKRAADGAVAARTAAGRGRDLLAATPRPVRLVLVGQLAALLLVALAFAVGPAALLQRFGGARPPSVAASAGGGGAPLRAAAAAATGAGAAERGGAAATPAPPAQYRTLSAPDANAGALTGAPAARIRVVFSETATEKQMRDVMLRVRGRLIDGPSPLGTYTLEVPAAAETPGASRAEAGADGVSDSLGCVLAYLHAQPAVRFAEPVAGAQPGGEPQAP